MVTIVGMFSPLLRVILLPVPRQGGALRGGGWGEVIPPGGAGGGGEHPLERGRFR